MEAKQQPPLTTANLSIKTSNHAGLPGSIAFSLTKGQLQELIRDLEGAEAVMKKATGDK